ncbi:lysostaphin resistance A-like protein [Halorubrum sp. DTA46]|uniref:CPBP family intramembrane glutamic endopeptidase n=1 Tax=Halorubrum sp. DTA46 TaxID=3402162 RepID=UPI003AAE5E8E
MTDDLPVPVDRLIAVASAVFALVFTLVVASVVGDVATSLAVRTGTLAEETNAHTIFQTVATFGSFLPAAVGYLIITDQRDLVPVSRPSLRRLGIVAAAAVGLYALQIGLLFVLREVGLRTGQNPATMAAGDPVVYYVAMIAVSILVVGPAEELLFRGVIQSGLRRAFGPVAAIALAAVMFGLLHAGVDGTVVEQLAYMGVTVILGAILGLLYEWTENVIVPALAHGLYNAIIFGTLLWSAL